MVMEPFVLLFLSFLDIKIIIVIISSFFFIFFYFKGCGKIDFLFSCFDWMFCKLNECCF